MHVGNLNSFDMDNGLVFVMESLKKNALNGSHKEHRRTRERKIGRGRSKIMEVMEWKF